MLRSWKTGPLWWRVDGLQQDWENGQAAIEWSEAYLHRADGMYFADEEVNGQHTPSRGTETCSVVCALGFFQDTSHTAST